MTRTILVSNRLPVRARPDGTLERTTGGLASALSGAGVDAVWVGWPGLPAEAIPDRDVVSAQLREIGVAPVLLTQHELDTYYEGYANATLWPLLLPLTGAVLFSQVVGALRPELSALDALRATFPAGTLSGAPKVRALEIVDALEPASRGWYGGAVGYLGYDGAADVAICIRSVVFTGDSVRVQAGAGIVYDSDPEAEDAECHAKASAVLRAIAMARAVEATARGEADDDADEAEENEP